MSLSSFSRHCVLIVPVVAMLHLVMMAGVMMAVVMMAVVMMAG